MVIGYSQRRLLLSECQFGSA